MATDDSNRNGHPFTGQGTASVLQIVPRAPRSRKSDLQVGALNRGSTNMSTNQTTKNAIASKKVLKTTSIEPTSDFHHNANLAPSDLSATAETSRYRRTYRR